MDTMFVVVFVITISFIIGIITYLSGKESTLPVIRDVKTGDAIDGQESDTDDDDKCNVSLLGSPSGYATRKVSSEMARHVSMNMFGEDVTRDVSKMKRFLNKLRSMYAQSNYRV